MNKEERQNFFNQLGEHLPEKKFIAFINIISQLEDEISDLRKKLYSLDFVKKRVKKFYLKDQPFTKFLVKLLGEA